VDQNVTLKEQAINTLNKKVFNFISHCNLINYNFFKKSRRYNLKLIWVRQPYSKLSNLKKIAKSTELILNFNKMIIISYLFFSVNIINTISKE